MRSAADDLSAAAPPHLYTASQPQPGTELLEGLIHQTPASIATTMTPGITESHVPEAAMAPTPAHPFEDSASANVATRDEVWRLRK